MVLVSVMSNKFVIAVVTIVLIIYVAQVISVLVWVRGLKDELLAIPAKHIIRESEAGMYREYLKRFNKNYDTDELKKRFKWFKESLKEINGMNELTGAVHGLTKFSDMSKEEKYSYAMHSTARTGMGFYDQPLFEFFNCTLYSETFGRDRLKRSVRLSEDTNKDKVDWREKGVIGPVLDQKQCNGCWAFGIAGLMESMDAIKRKRSSIVRRSIQELLDCFADNKGKGCNGGNVDNALKWLCMSKVGVVTEDEYPLMLVNEECKIDQDKLPHHPGLHAQLVGLLKNSNEEDILSLVATHGPVMAVVNAVPWLNYINGVIQRGCYRSHDHGTLDHVVQIVGYDKRPETGEVPHYIIKNSWGSDFGINGYVKLALNQDICGISEQISYLDVD